MHNIFLGVGIFLFSASIALNVYSYRLLRRSIDVMRFTLNILERLNRIYEETFRKEGTL